MRRDLLPRTFAGALSKVMQECGEVIQDASKLQMFGRYATDPKTGIGYNNIKALLKECRDLEQAIIQLRKFNRKEHSKCRFSRRVTKTNLKM